MVRALQLASPRVCPATQKILIAAERAGLELRRCGEGGRSCVGLPIPELLWKSDTPTRGTNAVLTLISRLSVHPGQHLRGQSFIEESQVESWMEWTSTEVDHSLEDPDCELQALFLVLEAALQRRTFLVGQRLTLADISAAVSLQKRAEEVGLQKLKDDFPHFVRWLQTCIHQLSLGAPRVAAESSPTACVQAALASNAAGPARANAFSFESKPAEGAIVAADPCPAAKAIMNDSEVISSTPLRQPTFPSESMQSLEGSAWSTYGKIGEASNRKMLQKLQQHSHGYEWVATEKVHGANFCFETDGTCVEYAKRTTKLTQGEKFYNVWETMPSYHPMVLKAFSLAKETNCQMARLLIYGEYFGGYYPSGDSQDVALGGKVQIGIAYSPEHLFYAFDVCIDGERYLDFDDAINLLKKAGFPLVAEPIKRGSLEQCLGVDVESLETDVPRRLGREVLPDYRIAEGIVVRPTKELPASLKLDRGILKKKASAFWEATHQPGQAERARQRNLAGSALPAEVLQALQVASSYVTENRLTAVVSKEGPTVLEEKNHMKLVGLMTRDVVEAVTSDHQDVVQGLKKEIGAWKKELQREVSLFVAEHGPMLKERLS